MTKMKHVTWTLAILVVMAEQAVSETVCNQHGAVVTMPDGAVLYLGKNCDAARKGGGTGAWWNAASFLVVEIDGKPYRVAEGTGIDCLPFCENPL